jgi:molybdopterin biosynthesis enzyme
MAEDAAKVGEAEVVRVGTGAEVVRGLEEWVAGEEKGEEGETVAAAGVTSGQ